MYTWSKKVLESEKAIIHYSLMQDFMLRVNNIEDRYQQLNKRFNTFSNLTGKMHGHFLNGLGTQKVFF